MLRCDIVRSLGGFRLEVALEVPAASTLALVGESGSGKTTLLRALAGLIEPERGRIALGDEVWLDTARGIARPAHARAVGYVAQDYALFPHLTVADNVGFGLSAQRRPAREVRERAAAALERMGIADLARRRPRELSGGQQQRVALARALVLEPALLLLDEPLAALDLPTRRAIRGELRALFARLSCVTIYVTHQPGEAILFGDRIAVIADGRIGQCEPPEVLLRRPRSAYVAELMGLNLLRGRVIERSAGGLARIACAGGECVIPDAGLDGEIFVVLDPRDITLSIEAPSGSAQNRFHGTVEEIVPEPPFGERVRVALSTRPPLVAEVTRQSIESLGLVAGSPVYATFKATSPSVFT